MVGCWCFAARPGSPGAEAVVAKRASNGGPGGLAKAGRPDDDAENRENELIGTAVAPAGAKPEPPPPTEPLGLAGEGSAAPLLGGDQTAGRSTSAAADGGGAQAAGDSTLEAGAADVAADGAAQAQEAEEPAFGPDSAASSSGAEPAAAAAAAPAAEEPEAAAAAEASGRHSSPGEEGSQAALLPAEEVSLKQPRMSRLSALFSCSSSGAVAEGGERHSRPQSTPGGDGGSSAASAGGQGHQQELCFESAAAELVLLRRDKLLPLAQPEAALADAASLLGRQEAPVLLTLRRVAIHHHSLLAGSLEDVVALLLECLHGGSEEVGQAAIMALLDLLMSFGNPMLRYCEQRLVPHHCCLLSLLMAASLGRTPAIRYWAEEALSWMAQRMHQGRVISLLEPYLEHELAPVRQKTAQHLMVATYRPPDVQRPSSSPVRRTQRS